MGLGEGDPGGGHFQEMAWPWEGAAEDPEMSEEGAIGTLPELRTPGQEAHALGSGQRGQGMSASQRYQQSVEVSLQRPPCGLDISWLSEQLSEDLPPLYRG